MNFRCIRGLYKFLEAAKTKVSEVRVQLQADDGVNYGQVAKAMASIEPAGITKLAVITAR